ncbi:MAG: hypothetical protein EHM93_05365 [Bacteroidales bacterium]|nr:MAG: hypothetical protein EHM93_05365 [Bacteroidales bacterium]
MNKILLLWRMTRYNLQIVFSGKFIWFLLASIAFFLFISTMMAFNDSNIQIKDIYDSLVFPGMLLMFYPTVFGIQHDTDSRTIELLFGIPDYRFKVWLFRILIIFVFVFILLIAFAFAAWILFEPIPIVEFAFHLMFPLIFLGSMAFWVSTIIRNGNATAVVMVILGIILSIFSEMLRNSYWNILLNPYQVPSDLNPQIWAKIIFKNRIFLTAGSMVFLLAGMLKLQKREKFI